MQCSQFREKKLFGVKWHENLKQNSDKNFYRGKCLGSPHTDYGLESCHY